MLPSRDPLSRSSLLPCLALIAVPMIGLAQTEPIRVDYQAHVGCPDQEAFLAELKARTQKARLAGKAEKARTFKIRITQGGPGSVGRIEAHDVGGGVTVREVSGGKCAEVVSALALTAALAIDPDALFSPPPPASASSTTPPVAASSAAPVASSAAPVTSASPVTSVSAPPTTPPEPSALLTFAGHFVVASGTAPELSVGGSIGAELRAGGGPVAPGIRLSLAHVRNDVARDPTTAFAASWVGFDVCPVIFAFTARLSASPCATGVLGLLRGESRGVRNPAAATAPWVTVGALARLRVVLVGGLAVELDAGLSLPVSRPVFKLEEPNVELHRVPTLTWVASGGMSYTL